MCCGFGARAFPFWDGGSKVSCKPPWLVTFASSSCRDDAGLVTGVETYIRRVQAEEEGEVDMITKEVLASVWSEQFLNDTCAL